MIFGENSKNTSFFVPLKKADGLEEIDRKVVIQQLNKILDGYELNFSKKDEIYPEMVDRICYNFGTKPSQYKNAKSFQDVIKITLNNKTSPSPAEKNILEESKAFYNSLLN